MKHLRNSAIQALILLGASKFSIGATITDLTLRPYTEVTSLAGQARGMQDDHGHEMAEPKSKPWLGYYDFLITEGSYKFWVVFELFTVALLVYSAFAALYYAKYTVSDYEDDDYFFKKRSSRSIQQQQQPFFLGLSAETCIRIFDAIADLSQKYSNPRDRNR